MYREPVINVVVVGLEQNCVRVVPGLGPQIHWSRDKLGLVPFIPWGTTRRVWGSKVKTHNERASTAWDSQRWQWEEKGSMYIPEQIIWCCDQDQWRS